MGYPHYLQDLIFIEPETLFGETCDIPPSHLQENWVGPPEKKGRPNFSRGSTDFYKRVDRFLREARVNVDIS